jgi:uncharacterized membrane protein (UPF0127 family)
MQPGLLHIANPDSGTVVCDRARVADTFVTRLVGLLGRTTFEQGEGLWITPSSGVHTFGMSIPIDIVALDQNLRVLQAAARTGPWRIAGLGWSVSSVLELPAGQIERSRISVGDRLCISRCEPQPPISAFGA